MSEKIYKIVTSAQWAAAEKVGRFTGAPIDIADGYVHMSTAGQVRETAAKHFAGQDDLLLVTLDPALMGGQLKWEPSRGGALFPHLYGPLEMEAVLTVCRLPMDAAGRHLFPDGIDA